MFNQKPPSLKASAKPEAASPKSNPSNPPDSPPITSLMSNPLRLLANGPEEPKPETLGASGAWIETAEASGMEGILKRSESPVTRDSSSLIGGVAPAKTSSVSFPASKASMRSASSETSAFLLRKSTTVASLATAAALAMPSSLASLAASAPPARVAAFLIRSISPTPATSVTSWLVALAVAAAIWASIVLLVCAPIASTAYFSVAAFCWTSLSKPSATPSRSSPRPNWAAELSSSGSILQSLADSTHAFWSSTSSLIMS